MRKGGGSEGGESEAGWDRANERGREALVEEGRRDRG